MGEKTNKSYKKRLKLTKNGKVVQRSPGIGHFNAKESRKGQLKKKRPKIFSIAKNKIKQYMPYG
ncbi:50S ribosomal protein L35 [Patescibacteria group bacterium]|nr:50S ribosomal protein L35 [Patescibacteria group bacterium]MBU2632890.1 50S ribosomal protein L35 [Patescibacteria group bacterium]